MDGWSVFIEFVHYHWLSRTPCSCTPPFYAVGSITIYIVSSYLRLCSCQILTLNSSTLAYFFFNSYCTAGCPARSLLPFTEFFKVTLLFSSFTSLNLICYPHLTYCFYKLYFSREHTHIYIYMTLKLHSLQFLVLSHFKTWHLAIFLQTAYPCLQIPSDPTQPPCPTLHHIIPLSPCIHISVCASLSASFQTSVWTTESTSVYLSLYIILLLLLSYWSKYLIFLTDCLSFLGSSWEVNIRPTCFVISVVQNFNCPSGLAV